MLVLFIDHLLIQVVLIDHYMDQWLSGRSST